MPIERRDYYPKEDPKKIILAFHKDNPEYAYAPEEIAVKLALPLPLVRVDLLFLASYKEVQSVWGDGGDVYYQITKK
jgi:hypothetical protein